MASTTSATTAFPTGTEKIQQHGQMAARAYSRVPNPSLWLGLATSVKSPSTFAPLAENRQVDVAVIGGGIVGVSTALLCKEAGRSVALLVSR